MKDVLRQLLEAEEAGRQAAGDLEAAGETLLRQARAESENFVRDARSDTEKQVAALKRQAEDDAKEGRKSVEVETDAAIERLRNEAAQRRPRAVQRVVGLLLNET